MAVTGCYYLGEVIINNIIGYPGFHFLAKILLRMLNRIRIQLLFQLLIFDCLK